MAKTVVVSGVTHPQHMAYTHEQLAEDLKTGHTVISSTFPPTQDGTVPSIKVGRIVGSTEPQPIVEAVGSGSERWPNQGWTESGDGTNYPGLPSQAQTDAIVAQNQAKRDARSSAEKLPAPEQSESEKNAAAIDQDLHPEKYEEPA